MRSAKPNRDGNRPGTLAVQPKAIRAATVRERTSWFSPPKRHIARRGVFSEMRLCAVLIVVSLGSDNEN